LFSRFQLLRTAFSSDACAGDRSRTSTGPFVLRLVQAA
jgi:hypothetical protein